MIDWKGYEDFFKNINLFNNGETLNESKLKIKNQFNDSILHVFFNEIITKLKISLSSTEYSRIVVYNLKGDISFYLKERPFYFMLDSNKNVVISANARIDNFIITDFKSVDSLDTEDLVKYILSNGHNLLNDYINFILNYCDRIKLNSTNIDYFITKSINNTIVENEKLINTLNSYSEQKFGTALFNFEVKHNGDSVSINLNGKTYDLVDTYKYLDFLLVNDYEYVNYYVSEYLLFAIKTVYDSLFGKTSTQYKEIIEKMNCNPQKISPFIRPYSFNTLMEDFNKKVILKTTTNVYGLFLKAEYNPLTISAEELNNLTFNLMNHKSKYSRINFVGEDNGHSLTAPNLWICTDIATVESINTDILFEALGLSTLINKDNLTSMFLLSKMSHYNKYSKFKLGIYIHKQVEIEGKTLYQIYIKNAVLREYKKLYFYDSKLISLKKYRKLIKLKEG